MYRTCPPPGVLGVTVRNKIAVFVVRPFVAKIVSINRRVILSEQEPFPLLGGPREHRETLKTFATLIRVHTIGRVGRFDTVFFFLELREYRTVRSGLKRTDAEGEGAPRGSCPAPQSLRRNGWRTRSAFERNW